MKSTSDTGDRRGIAAAVLAAVLFGASTPLVKVVSPRVDPVLMAGLLYFGSGLGLGAYAWLRTWRKSQAPKEAALTRQDVPWLAGSVLSGGVVAPVLLMWGLAQTPASTASLLLNVEGMFTVLVAWFVFKENFDVRIAGGMGLIAAGGVCLTWMGWPATGALWRALAITGACFAWAVDNNLTRKVSAGDPVQIATLKGLVAGGVTAALALALGAKLPGAPVLLAVGLIGLGGYGLSLTLFVLALRHLGTARTSAYFSTAPFIGAAVSILFLGDRLTLGFGIAAVLMGAGVWLHLAERHEHEHRHEPTEHEHIHSHDEHHRHSHPVNAPAGEPHTHPHRHEPLVHVHPHYPDIHHRHEHLLRPRGA